MKVEDDSKAKCTECGAAVSAKIERLRNHHARCIPQTSTKVEIAVHINSDNELPSTSTAAAVAAGVPAVRGDDTLTVNQSQSNKCFRHDEADTHGTTSSSEQQDKSIFSSKKGKLQQPHISKFGVTNDKKSQDQLDEQVARFFFACNIPSAVVEQQEFKQHVSKLRP